MNVMRDTLLREIRRRETEYQNRPGPDKWRLRFHIMPPAGWLNDPNGLCFYRGKYHFFFQYSPFDPEGGLKVWGEYTGTDLVHWQYEGTPLLPDSPWDCHGVYSGCAFTEDGLLDIFYTGNVKLDGDYDYVNSGREANTIYTCSEDGIHFREKECLLEMKDYPTGYTNHIRDPKVWKAGDTCYMVLGGRKKDNRGAVLLYASKDKKHWEFVREVTTREPFGYMWECPDAFCLDGQWLLSVSPQGLKREEFCRQNIYQSGYFILPEKWMEEGEPKEFREWDMGFDFYAPQTFRDEKGRRILVGWAGLPDIKEEYNNPTVEQGWQHAFTMPRELKWKNGKVYQYPVKEAEMLREKELFSGSRQDRDPEKTQGILVEDSCFDWEIKETDSRSFSIKIEEECVLKYEDGVFSLSFEGIMGAGRKVRKALVPKLYSIRILADTSLMEIYLNEGEYVFTSRYYTESDVRQLSVRGLQNAGNIWTMKKQTCLTGL